MGIGDETSNATGLLLAKHLESVVNFRFQRPLGGSKNQGGGQEELQYKGKEDNEKAKAGAQARVSVSYGTGFVVHCTDSFALLLSCAHTFTPLQTCGPEHGAADVDEDITLDVDFFDGYSTTGFVCKIDWSYDVSLVMVLLGSGRGPYRPVQFTKNSCPLMGFRYNENAHLLSVFCFPAEQEQALFGTAMCGKITGPPRLGQDVDPKLHPELKMVQFGMDGAQGCSGAPLFTMDLVVMGIWISHVGDIKFGVHVDSILEWLRRAYKIEERTMNEVVSKIGLLYSMNFAKVDQMDISGR